MFTLTIRVPDDKKERFLKGFLAGVDITGITPKRASERKLRRYALNEVGAAEHKVRYKALKEQNVVDETIIEEPE